MKFNDSFEPKAFSESLVHPSPIADQHAEKIDAASETGPPAKGSGYNFNTLYPLKEPHQSDRPLFARVSREKDLSRFEERLKKRKVKLCASCGGIMTKSTRLILSASAGITLILMGLMLMAFYGWATNFYQPPWFIKFVLPAAYYIGSIFIGVGVVFFFIRERIWACQRCREIEKR